MARRVTSGVAAWIWLATAALSFGSWVSAQPSSRAATLPTVLLGSYQGAYGTSSVGPGTLVDSGPWISQTKAFHAWQGRGEAVAVLYAGASPDSNPMLINALTTIWNQGEVPSLTWWVTNSNTDNAVAASGGFDASVNRFINMLKVYLAGPDGVLGTADDRRLYLRLDSEANGDWYGYSPDYRDPALGYPPDIAYQQNVANFKAMWRRFHTLFTNAGIDSTHVAWIFSVSTVDAYRRQPVTGRPEPIAEDIYPGSPYVDWVGVDGYNSVWGVWTTPDQVFDGMVQRLEAVAPSKPLGVTEVGCSTVSSTPAAKAQWVTNYFSWLRGPVGGAVKMTVWFNSDVGSNDYTVFGGKQGDTTFAYSGTTYNAYSAYQSAVSASTWLEASDPTNPRLLTDAQFLGG